MDVEFSALRLLDLVAVGLPARSGELPGAARVVDGETADVVRRLLEHRERPGGDEALGAHPAARRLDLDVLVIAAERHVARARDTAQE